VGRRIGSAGYGLSPALSALITRLSDPAPCVCLLVADQLVWGDPLVLAQCVVRAEFIRGLIPVLWRKLERDLSALIVLPDEQVSEGCHAD